MNPYIAIKKKSKKGKKKKKIFGHQIVNKTDFKYLQYGQTWYL